MELIRAVRLTPSCYGVQHDDIVQVNGRAAREKLLGHAWGQDKVIKFSRFCVYSQHREYRVDH